jgi:hypothetical protein
MDGIDTQITRAELWSSVGYWILVAGLVGDIAVLVVPKHRERLEKLLAAFFTIVIIVGVAIEHRADAAISVLVSQKQAETALQIAQLDKEAGDARKTAGEAEERAAKAEAHLSESNERAARANERAADAERETERLKQRLADRTLTDAQAVAIERKLRAFAGQEFDFTPYWDTKESIAIANRIADLLNGAGWKYIPPTKSGFMLGGVTRVLVHVHPNAPAKVTSAAGALVSALNEQRIVSEIRYGNTADPPDSKLHLYVGTKP